MQEDMFNTLVSSVYFSPFAFKQRVISEPRELVESHYSYILG